MVGLGWFLTGGTAFDFDPWPCVTEPWPGRPNRGSLGGFVFFSSGPH